MNGSVEDWVRAVLVRANKFLTIFAIVKISSKLRNDRNMQGKDHPDSSAREIEIFSIVGMKGLTTLNQISVFWRCRGL